VRPIRRPEAMKSLLLISFQDAEEPPKTKPAKAIAAGNREKCGQLEQELKYTKDKLQSTMEEMQASQEELRSMNEAMQSTNEELQSTNEELTTSKEELQSLNEELVTVNSELQSKLEDRTRTSDDMRNLLNSTAIATIFLDNKFKIKRFTPSATGIVNLQPADVGRPITDISTNIKGTNDGSSLILQESRKVMETLTPIERQIETKNERWYTMRILPYRAAENVISGVVITFDDVTDIKHIKHLEQSAKDSLKYAESFIATIREPLVVLDDTMHVVTASKVFYETFRVSPAETEGRLLFELGNGQWNIPELKKQLMDVLPKKRVLENFKVEQDFPGIGHRIMVLNARMIETGGKIGLILLAIQNVDA
jgi:two-component system CheB/CheR fusion protein